MKKVLYLLLTFFCIAYAQDGKITVVAVGDAEQEKDRILIEKFSTPKELVKLEVQAIEELNELFVDNFNFYRHFFDVQKYKKEGEINFSLKGEIKVIEGKLLLTLSLKDHVKNKILFKSEDEVWVNNVRSYGHHKSDEVYQAIKGVASVFKSKILFVSDRTSTSAKQNKELYIMDFDGKRKQRLTFNNSLIISPAISSNNEKVLFSAIDSRWVKGEDTRPHKIQNINLYMYDMKTKHLESLSSIDGINSGAVFSADGKSIYLTLSYQKNADIYEMDLKTRKLRRITTHMLDDVDPHVNESGDLMTFLSGRSGKAMIYTMDPKGQEKDVKRISYVGRFNAAPRFSPDGKEIVFSSWVDNCFDLYKIGSDGNNLVRLTKNFGSNEEAWFSPDGQFIVFTSQTVINSRKAVQNIYIMNREGEIISQLTDNYGKTFTPRWSK